MKFFIFIFYFQEILKIYLEYYMEILMIKIEII